MDLQEKLIELSEYGVSFNVANSNFVVRIKYKNDWEIIKPEDKDISFYQDDDDKSLFYYVSPITLNIDKIFSAIDETINYNKELEQKVVLYRETILELQKLFTVEPLEVLKTIEFKFKRKKDKSKKEKVITETDTTENPTQQEDKKEEKESDIDTKIIKAITEKKEE